MKHFVLIITTILTLMTLTACNSVQEKTRAQTLKTEMEQSKLKVKTTKPAYIVFTREKTLDRAELEIYWQMVPATLKGRPIKVLSGYGPHEVLEGSETEGVVIAEFPSLEEAKAWYNSPAYREAREHRFKGAVYRGILVEATTPPN